MRRRARETQRKMARRVDDAVQKEKGRRKGSATSRNQMASKEKLIQAEVLRLGERSLLGEKAKADREWEFQVTGNG